MKKKSFCHITTIARLLILLTIGVFLQAAPLSARGAYGDLWLRLMQARPADLTSELKPFIGQYGGTLTVREEAGRLQLLTGKDSVDLIQREGLEFSSAGKESIVFEAPSGGLSPAVRRGGKRFTRDNPDVRITPLRPIADLSREARAASPPPQKSDMFKPDLVELTRLDSSIKLDIRYATADNFMGAPFYSQPRAFLQRPAAQAVVRFHRFLKEHGLGLVIFDAYRPWYVTRMFWDATPPEKRNFVADPALGSRHNRGTAVDLTIYDSASGRALDMGGAYDEFSSRSFIDFPGGTELQRWNRQFLKAFMEQEGFTVFHDEWWHYDYKDRDRYPVLNLTFEQLHQAQAP